MSRLEATSAFGRSKLRHGPQNRCHASTADKSINEHLSRAHRCPDRGCPLHRQSCIGQPITCSIAERFASRLARSLHAEDVRSVTASTARASRWRHHQHGILEFRRLLAARAGPPPVLRSWHGRPQHYLHAAQVACGGGNYSQRSLGAASTQSSTACWEWSPTRAVTSEVGARSWRRAKWHCMRRRDAAALRRLQQPHRTAPRA